MTNEHQPKRLVPVNGPTAVICAREHSPFVLTEQVATTQDPETGEEIAILRSATDPFTFYIRGDMLHAEVSIKLLIQETILHVLAGNGKPQPEPTPAGVVLDPVPDLSGMTEDAAMETIRTVSGRIGANKVREIAEAVHGGPFTGKIADWPIQMKRELAYHLQRHGL